MFYANDAGSVNYYKKEGDKAGYNDLICSVDKAGNISEEISQAGMDTANLSDEELLNIQNTITTYVSGYSGSQFYNVYSFKEGVNAQIQENLYVNALDSLTDKTTEAVSQNTFSFVRTTVDGILALYTDGYEDVSADNFKAEMYNPASYVKTNLKGNAQVTSGQALYKIATSEDWTLMVPITEKEAKEYQKKIKFAVASLLNGMTEESLKIYQDEKIELHYLVKTDHSGYGTVAEQYRCDGLYICAIPENHTQESADIDVQSEKNMREHIISIPGWMNARRFVDAKQYEAACKKLAKTVITETVVKQGERVLVIGTEEFMYPALLTGYEIEKMGCVVRCHSTTRSPIAVSTGEEYPLHCRYELRSLYDPDRKTFIYDLENYDRVIVMTDAALASLKGLETLIYALRMKNENITVIRWC